MDPSSRPDSIEITDYPAILRRRWRLVLLATAAGLAAAFALVLVSPKTYSSQASIQVTETGADEAPSNARGTGGANLDTEAQIVKSTEVAARARELLKSSENPGALADRVTVTVPPNSSILTIAYDGPSATEARDGARAFSQAYLDNRAASARGKLDADIKNATERLDKLTARLQEVVGMLRLTTRGTAARANAQNQQRIITGEIQALNERLASANIKASNITPGTVITGASLPDTPSNPNPRLYLPAGLMAGLLFGLVIAVLRDRADKHIRHPQDIERTTGLPVLMTTPFGRREATLDLQLGRSRIGQSFNQLAHLVTATLGHGNHVILVTGAASGVGPGVVAANLAAAFVRTESKVMLVCANLDSSASADLLGVPPGPGLAEVLLEQEDLAKVARVSPRVPNLRVITSGVDVDMASELLQRQNMDRLIERLRRTVGYVIIETASTTVSADAQALADAADAALVVVEIPLTRHDDVALGLRQLERMGTAVLGAVGVPEQGEPKPSPQPPQRRPAPAAMRRPAAAAQPAIEPGQPDVRGSTPGAGPGQPVVEPRLSRRRTAGGREPRDAREARPARDRTESDDERKRFENGDTLRFKPADVLDKPMADKRVVEKPSSEKPPRDASARETPAGEKPRGAKHAPAREDRLPDELGGEKTKSMLEALDPTASPNGKTLPDTTWRR
ncbi:Wzz/FepE/Etk N-terminal domain-containing protein [Actinomadura sp. 9N215]|uniref:Wzz/FepE/Etk N-terminal domain-containing protein n=1 Tax=Actinomadura sp. 9N215 TaxID=3375150 RepID=UPI0037B7AD3E